MKDYDNSMPKQKDPSFTLPEDQVATMFPDLIEAGDEVEVKVRLGETDASGNVELFVVGEPEVEEPEKPAPLPYLKSSSKDLPTPPPIDPKSLSVI